MDKVEFLGVALFTRAWIEILDWESSLIYDTVALFTRAWIEMLDIERLNELFKVALFTRAWIEITWNKAPIHSGLSPSSRGRGLKCKIFD